MEHRNFIPTLQEVLTWHNQTEAKADEHRSKESLHATSVARVAPIPSQEIFPLTTASLASVSGSQNQDSDPTKTNSSQPTVSSSTNTVSAPPFSECKIERVNGLLACPWCSKGFLHRAALEIHYRTHTGERPFSCDLCSKAFGSKGNLKTHMRAHSGKKHYSCSECDMCFTQSAHLERHIQTHRQKQEQDAFSSIEGSRMVPEQHSSTRLGPAIPAPDHHHLRGMPSQTTPSSSRDTLDQMLQRVQSSANWPHSPSISMPAPQDPSSTISPHTRYPH